MVLQQRLSLKLAQRLVMTPSLQQAIKLLQMTRLELEGVLNQEMVENPVLEDGEEEEESEEGTHAESADRDDASAPDSLAGDAAAAKADDGAAVADSPDDGGEPDEPSMDDIDLDAYFNDYLGPDSTTANTFESREISPIENNFSRAPDLADHLLWQLRMSDAPPRLREIAELVIGNLDHDGFLRASVEEIQLLGAEAAEVERYRSEVAMAREMTEALAPVHADNGGGSATPAVALETGLRSVPAPGYRVEWVQRALYLVRSFDPPGVAWQSLQECLLAQLEAQEATGGLAYRIVGQCWDLFARRQFRLVARRLRIPLAELEAPIEAIKALETRPGRKFSHHRTEYVEPDVVAVKTGGEWAIQLNDDGLPKLRISGAYRKMLQRMQREKSETEAREFLKDKMRSAMWLIKSLDQRQRTIYKVAESILRQQRGFFDHGIDEMRPMVLRDVADDIGMHESTVSRVVSNKYIHTPRGLFPMKFFFHSGIDRQRGGEISSLTVKRKLRGLIGEENGRRPLSDSALTRELQREGINIARRTVAKYRDELGIPSSNDRKQIF